MNEMRKDEILDGRFRLVEKRGRGSYGEVWLARDLQLDVDVAVKVYFALDERGNKELADEFTTSFELNHPNLLRSIYLGRNDERSFIVMPFCPTSSSQLIGCCNSHMMWEFVSDVAHGLAYLHSKGIIHHDIKPDNILMGEDGHYVISDFGISTQMRSTLRRNGGRDDYESGKVSGSIAYMGPEMFTDDPFAVANTDIWAFGATLYEFVAGELPFHGQGGVMLNHGAELPEIPFGFVSHNLVDLIHACLSKETWDRPVAHEIARYADMALANEDEAPSWKAYFDECRRHEGGSEPKKNRWWIGVAAAVAVVAGAVWVYLSGNPKHGTELVENPPQEDTIQNAMTLAQVRPAQATFLKVNGSEKPKPVTIASSDTLKVVSVDTDGLFSVSENLPKWLTLSYVDDTSFVLHLEPNHTAEKRTKTIEVFSGSIVRKITIVQSPDKDKALKAKLTPASNGLQQTPNESNDQTEEIEVIGEIEEQE